MTRPDGLGGPLVLVGRARDILTGDDGTVRVMATGSLDAIVDFVGDRSLIALTTDPVAVGTDLLVGARVASGFRAVLEETLAPTEREHSTLVHTLLDDLPGATLVSGFAMSHGGQPHSGTGRAAARPDICAGWVTGGTIMLGVETIDRSPTPTGPAAPPLDRADDPDAWHTMAALGPHAMRRRRRTDVIGGESLAIDAMFRDSHVSVEGEETVVHEYTLRVCIEREHDRIASIDAEPRVLPWVECPEAAASAQRLIGLPLGDLRAWVRAHLSGISTCTHLNDMLRALDDVAALVAHVDKQTTGGR